MNRSFYQGILAAARNLGRATLLKACRSLLMCGCPFIPGSVFSVVFRGSLLSHCSCSL